MMRRTTIGMTRTLLSGLLVMGLLPQPVGGARPRILSRT